MENVHPLRLRLLLEIERTGSISAAAQACRIAQPSASMHLRTLESAIGERLVTRNGRGSRLTCAGKIVASHAERVLATFDGMRRALETLHGRGGGELSLAASIAPSMQLLPLMLREYSARYPGVTVNLRTVPSHTVVREVLRGTVELGIAGEVPAAEPVFSRQILLDEIVGIAPPGVVSLDQGRVTPAELARHRLVLGPEASSTRMVIERYLTALGYRPTRVWTFDCYETIKRTVAEGLGLSFVSRIIAHDEVQQGALVAFGLTGVKRMTRPIYIWQSGTRESSPEGAAFAQLLADARPSPADQWEPITEAILNEPQNGVRSKMRQTY
jgi:molybdate transport repressor ModE-like protein